MRRVGIAGALLAALIAAFFAGRGTAPAKTVEKLRTVEVVKEVAAKQKDEAKSAHESLSVREITKWKIVSVRHPDGTLVRTAEGERGGSSESKSAKEETRREVEVRYVDRKVEVEKIKVVDAAKPDWAVTLGAGLQAGPRGVYRGEVARRIVGPFWVGAWADTAKTAGISLRMEW